MKSIFLALGILAAAPALAHAPVPAYVMECRAAAVYKLEAQARAQHAALIPGSIQMSNIDDRPYNPSKYVWFSAVAVRPGGMRIRLQVMTQKSFRPLRACF